MEQQWVRAVRVEEAGTLLHVVLQCNATKAAAAAAASTGDQEATYQLCVLDAQGSRAWSSCFSRDDVEEALRQDLTDLGQLLDTALAASASLGNIRMTWSGAAAASCLHLELQYDRQDFVPAIFRLPPFGEMEMQQGADFKTANARVLDVLTQQNSTLQQAASLLQTKLQELASHAQRVHESYCDAVDSMAAQPGHDYTAGSILDRTAAAAAAAEPASKRQRVGEVSLASLSPGGVAPSSGSRLDAAAAAAAAAAAGLQLPFSLDIAPPLPPPLAAAAAAAGGSNGGLSRPLITPTKKGKPKQLSSHERMLHRVASGHWRLRQDWNGWLRQLLQAQDTAEAQQAVAGRLGGQQQQQQQQQKGGLAAAGSGQLEQQQQQQQLEHGSPEAQSLAPAAAAAEDEDDQPVDEDDVAIRIVHKPRAKKHAGGPIFGTLSGKQQPAAREGSSGPAGA